MKWMKSFAVIAVLFLTSGAYAHPPYSFVLQSVAKKKAVATKSVKIQTTVNEIEDGEATGLNFKQVTVYDSQRRVMRSRAYNMNGAELYAVERKLTPENAAGGQNGWITSALLMDSDAAMLTQTVNAWGLNFPPQAGVTHLDRFNGKALWPIETDNRKCRLWIDKDTLLPARSLSDGIEVRFEDYRFVITGQGEYPFPRKISLVRNEDIVLREDLVELFVNPHDASDFKGQLKPGFTEEGESADSSLKDLIQEYYRAVR